MLCALLPLSAWAQPQTATEPADSAWVLATLTQPPPVATAFLELRESRTLDVPLRISGEYARPDAQTLVREVRAPYRETTTIRDGEAVIAREGRSPRRVRLSRVPELAALQASFGALLAGDRAALERQYTLSTEGDRQAWTLTLVPSDAAVARRLEAIVLHGDGDALRCIESRPARGEAQRTLLGAAAADAAPDLDAAGLAARCAGARSSR